MKLSIVIPVFNEAATVSQLLNQVWNKELESVRKELVIVESNSSDGSREKVQEFVNRAKAEPDKGEVRLILQPGPRGKGAATREGIAAATGEIVLIQDADLEYSVDDYPALIQPIVTGKASFVLGSRHLGAGNWKIRKFEESTARSSIMNLGGIFFHGFFNLVYGTRLTDPTTMYKVFLRSKIEGMGFVSDRFDFDYEITAKLIRSGNVPLEVPVSYVSRGFEEGKKIRVFRDPLTWVWAILRFRFTSLEAGQLLVTSSSPGRSR